MQFYIITAKEKEQKILLFRLFFIRGHWIFFKMHCER